MRFSGMVELQEGKMIRLSKTVLATGGVILGAVLLTAAAPRTVHAIAAALVEVTNTASNPVVTQSIGQQAAQSVYLSCYPASGSGNGTCYSVSNGVQSGTPYVVPANESLAVTAVDVYTYVADHEVALGYPACNAGREDAIFVNGGGAILIWEIVDDTSPTHFTYPSGVVFGPSSTLSPSSRHYSPGLDGQCGSDTILVYGYLTAS
jgi:hypothetical protein